MELKKAVGSIYDKQNNFSIDSFEFGRLIGAAAGAATVSTLTTPAKFYVGVNTELLPSNNILLSGAGTQGTNITARINITAAVPAGFPVLASLISNYDAIIEVYPMEMNAVVRQ